MVNTPVHLETATLQGELSAVPGIPNRNIKVDVIDEGPACVLQSTNGRFGVAIPYDQLKSAYAFSQEGSGLSYLASVVFTLGIWPTDAWLVSITWYSADLDQDVNVVLHIGNSAGGPLTFQRRAVALAKTLWTIRAERLATLRSVMVLRYR